MHIALSKEFLAGVAALGIGAAVVWGGLDYTFGTPRRMGPGFFPVVLGGGLALCGIAMMLSARKSAERLPALNWRPLLVLPSALLLFAILLPAFGYGPAGVGAILLAGHAERRPHLPSLTLLAVVLVGSTWALFAKALGVPLPLLTWGAS